MKVVITESLMISDDMLLHFKNKLSDLDAELDIYYDKASDEVLIERIKGADVAIIANHPLRENVIRKAKNLKMLNVAFTGLDHVDLGYLKEQGIVLKNASGYSDICVSELVIGLNLAIYRDVLKADSGTRQLMDKSGLNALEIHGKKVGIVGTGNIGTRTAMLYQSFGADVYGYSRTKRAEFQQYGKYISLEDLFRTCDIISIHLPLNDETRGFVDESLLSLMKDTAILINCARGPIVDRVSLSKALDERKILGAGIDVFDVEPPLNEECPYIDKENAVLTPHIAYYTAESMKRRAEIVFNNTISFIKEYNV